MKHKENRKNNKMIQTTDQSTIDAFNEIKNQFQTKMLEFINDSIIDQPNSRLMGMAHEMIECEDGKALLFVLSPSQELIAIAKELNNLSSKMYELGILTANQKVILN